MFLPVAYSHTQIGYDDLIASAAGGVVLIVAALAVRAQGNTRNLPRSTVRGAFGIAIISLLAFGITFSRMTVTVRDHALSWSFAFGLMRHRVPLSDVVAASLDRSTVNEGWGIHDTGSGTLYDVSGGWSVHVKLRDGSAVRLGTDQPDSLLQAIRASTR
jgi:hypothetical protein